MLPKIKTPTFELTQPSTGKQLMYRPFLVKEEKILLMAKESKEPMETYNAIRQIITNCVVTEGFNVDDIPVFDMEYIFLKLRSASVGNIVEFKVKDSDDNLEHKLTVNLDEVQVQFPENHDNKIKLTDDIGVVMKYPTPKIAEKLTEAESFVDIAYEMIIECIDMVFDEESTYAWKKNTDKEKEEFLDSLPIDAFEKLREFFETSPKIEHVVEYINSNGTTKKVVFRDLDDFFTLY